MEKDRTITQVVKLLQGMLEKSVKEGGEERVNMPRKAVLLCFHNKQAKLWKGTNE